MDLTIYENSLDTLKSHISTKLKQNLLSGQYFITKYS